MKVVRFKKQVPKPQKRITPENIIIAIGFSFFSIALHAMYMVMWVEVSGFDTVIQMTKLFGSIGFASLIVGLGEYKKAKRLKSIPRSGWRNLMDSSKGMMKFGVLMMGFSLIVIILSLM